MNDTKTTRKKKIERGKKLSISGEYQSLHSHTHALWLQRDSGLYPAVPHLDVLLLRLLPDVSDRCKTKAKGGTLVSRACDSALSDTLTRERLDAGDKWLCLSVWGCAVLCKPQAHIMTGSITLMLFPPPFESQSEGLHVLLAPSELQNCC